MIDIEWDPPQPKGSHRYRKASTIHGWVTKLRGTLTDNERVRNRGIREMREAHAIRVYKKKHPTQSKGRGNGLGSILYWFSFVPSKRDPSRQQIVVRRHRSDRRKDSRSSPQRATPHRHGHGSVAKGQLTGNPELVRLEKQRNQDPRYERHREHERRLRRSRRDAATVRSNGSATRLDWRR